MKRKWIFFFPSDWFQMINCLTPWDKLLIYIFIYFFLAYCMLRRKSLIRIGTLFGTLKEDLWAGPELTPSPLISRRRTRGDTSHACLNSRALCPALAARRCRGGQSWTTGRSRGGGPEPSDICYSWRASSSPAAPSFWWWRRIRGGEWLITGDAVSKDVHVIQMWFII